jgi:hypothetical protein
MGISRELSPEARYFLSLPASYSHPRCLISHPRCRSLSLLHAPRVEPPPRPSQLEDPRPRRRLSSFFNDDIVDLPAAHLLSLLAVARWPAVGIHSYPKLVAAMNADSAARAHARPTMTPCPCGHRSNLVPMMPCRRRSELVPMASSHNFFLWMASHNPKSVRYWR